MNKYFSQKCDILIIRMNILFFYIHFKDEKKAGFDIIKCNILI